MEVHGHRACRSTVTFPTLQIVPRRPSVMVNRIGARHARGARRIEGLVEHDRDGSCPYRARSTESTLGGATSEVVTSTGLGWESRALGVDGEDAVVARDLGAETGVAQARRPRAGVVLELLPHERVDVLRPLDPVARDGRTPLVAGLRSRQARSGSCRPAAPAAPPFAVSPVGGFGAPGCTVTPSATFDAGLRPAAPVALRAYTR